MSLAWSMRTVDGPEAFASPVLGGFPAAAAGLWRGCSAMLLFDRREVIASRRRHEAVLWGATTADDGKRKVEADGLHASALGGSGCRSKETTWDD